MIGGFEKRLHRFCLEPPILIRGVVAERIRAPNSSSADSVKQSVGSSPGHDNCVLEQDT